MANRDQWSSVLSGGPSPGPDYFLPEVFTLAGGQVAAMETSASDPRVRFDSSGVYVTSPIGKKEVAMDPSGLRLLASTGTVDAPTSTRTVRWVRETDGSVIAEVAAGYTEAGGPSFANLWAISDVNRNVAQLLTQSSDTTPSVTGAYAKTNTKVRKIVTEDGASDFVQSKIVVVGSAYTPLTGVVFNVSTPGTYMFTVGMSAFTGSAPGVGVSRHFVDGVFGGDINFFFNQNGVQAWMGEISWLQNLAAGNHTYTWSSPAGIALSYDGNCRHSITAIG